MLTRSVNPIIFANFALAVRGENRVARKSVSFLRVLEKSPNLSEKDFKEEGFTLNCFCLIAFAVRLYFTIRIQT